MNNLPFNWDCIQLCMNHHSVMPFYLHPVMRDSGSAHIDYLIFETGKTYSFPVFTVNTEFHSDQRETKLHPRDQPCRDAVIHFWKNESSSFDLNDFFYYNKPKDYLMIRKIELNKTKFHYN